MSDNDRGEFRRDLAVWALGTIAVLGGMGMTALALFGQTVPPELATGWGAAVGGLVTFLMSGRNNRT